MTQAEAQPRPAGRREAVALRDLEREANLVALHHVFPPERHCFPDADVLARWERLVDAAEVTVTVCDDPDGAGLVGLVAYDDDRVRHLVVRPDHWGSGLGERLLRNTEEALAAQGRREVRLTCLQLNARARRFYERLGWHLVGPTGRAEWPPYPVELEYVRTLP